MEEVLEFPNSRNRRITDLSISTSNRDNPRVAVRLAERDFGSVIYELSGDDDVVVALGAKLEDHLHGLRQWYTPLARFSLLYAMLVFNIVAVLVLLAAVAIDEVFSPAFLPDAERKRSKR